MQPCGPAVSLIRAKKEPEWIGTCVGLPADLLEAYDGTERAISYRTFARHVGREVIRELNERFGHAPPLRKDWAVYFSKGLWLGKPAVCMYQSEIHHLWYV